MSARGIRPSLNGGWDATLHETLRGPSIAACNHDHRTEGLAEECGALMLRVRNAGTTFATYRMTAHVSKGPDRDGFGGSGVRAVCGTFIPRPGYRISGNPALDQASPAFYPYCGNCRRIGPKLTGGA